MSDLEIYLSGSPSTAVDLLIKADERRWRRPGVSANDRRVVLARDKDCRICRSAESLHIDHFWPFAWGGAHSLDNYWLLCETCNKDKRDRLPTPKMIDLWRREIGPVPPPPSAVILCRTTSAAANETLRYLGL